VPHLEQLQAELGDKIKAVKLDAFDNQDVAAKYRVMAVPTVILFHNGQPAARWVGVTTKDVIKAKVQELKG